MQLCNLGRMLIHGHKQDKSNVFTRGAGFEQISLSVILSYKCMVYFCRLRFRFPCRSTWIVMCRQAKYASYLCGMCRSLVLKVKMRTLRGTKLDTEERRPFRTCVWECMCEREKECWMVKQEKSIPTHLPVSGCHSSSHYLLFYPDLFSVLPLRLAWRREGRVW